ncbi:diguanylate cyclase [Pseudoalteromonas tunicata]|uniref:GGDEF domain-containing protein n=1 Tax=Pseudoalteromonas tunicata TaxID=314281 RepID=UPI00273FF60D|nr:diguanylate cyclase [Pseudoalteromonas tunicata]MDP5213120.1 diguanylate cyclase [Pseudoalteromonas tunicata]
MIFSFQNASFKDPETGLYNQAYFMEVFVREWHRLIRDQDSLTIMFLNPHVNLKDEQQKTQFIELANIVRNQTLRSTDIVCRFNESFFALGLFGLDNNGTDIIINRIKSALQNKFTGLNMNYGAINLAPDNSFNVENIFEQTALTLKAAEDEGINCYKIKTITHH